MLTYTTCRGCGELLEVVARNQHTHPTCVAPADPLEQLCERFLAAATAGDHQRADRLEHSITQVQHAPPRLAQAALAYAAMGWAVFPLAPGGKTPLTRHGFKQASTDPDRIRAWWRASPDANIGVPTGRWFDVLDVDLHHGATRVWPRLRDSPNMPGAHGIAITQSRGLHVLLLPSGEPNAARMFGCDGIDYRGAGGYIVAAPSTVAGRRYVWQTHPSPMVTNNSAEGVAEGQAAA